MKNVFLPFFILVCGMVSAAMPDPPPAPREMRAAWIATIGNLDWPSSSRLTTAEQQAEILRILDHAALLKLNCLMLQVRPAADTFYESSLEPWSRYLTGERGKSPDPEYDPLRFWLDAAHQRGIEIHAWLNPYRVGQGRVGQSSVAQDRVGPEQQAGLLLGASGEQPLVIRQYGSQLWMDPAAAENERHFLAVVRDILQRYDIDGIHIDDYFYPYPIVDADRTSPFPDDDLWQEYRQSGGRTSRSDWRRSHVNRLVRNIYQLKNSVKPLVKFGISPFGIGRPGLVPDISGFDQYSQIYADPALWLRNGWCDYFVPQLYWPVDQRGQSFPLLHAYWLSENHRNIHVWPGLFTHGIRRTTSGFSTGEIQNQIGLVRAQSADAGHVHFGFRTLLDDVGKISSRLMAEQYTEDALIPAFPWLDRLGPSAPVVTLSGNDEIRVSVKPGEDVRLFAVWESNGSVWTFRTVPAASPADFRVNSMTVQAVVTAVDRCGNESQRVRVTIP
jgi:uncharacterized lipoprotein YddW (UPF0748 family)